jgi:hypothetical protein
MTTTRPGLYPYHDVNGTNITYPEDSAFLFTGYVAGVTPVPSADHNGKLNRSGSWHAYLDQNGLRNSDWLDETADSSLTLTALTYNNGGNVLTTGATVLTRGTYLVNNTRVETDSAYLNFIANSIKADPLVFPAAIVPGRIWIYANQDGPARFESVAPGTPDAPVGNEITLVGLDVDAVGVVTDGAVVPVTLPLPDYGLNVGIPFLLSSDLTVGGAVEIGGSLTVMGPLTAEDVAQFNIDTLISTTAGTNTTIGADATNYCTINSTTIQLGPTNLFGGVTIAYLPLNVNANAEFFYDVEIDGDVDLGVGAGNKTITIGSAAADTLIINATTNFGSTTMTGSGGTVSTTNVSATNVTVEELRFQTSVTTLPSVAGRIRWNDTFFSFMDGAGAIRTFNEPCRGYDATLTTAANPLTDTTAAATRRVKHNEPVWIEFGSHVETDSAGSNANYMLRITGPLGSSDVLTDAIVMASASKGYTWHEYIVWTPTDSWPLETDPQNYSFLVRMGTSAGNLTADRIGITVSCGVEV